MCSALAFLTQHGPPIRWILLVQWFILRKVLILRCSKLNFNEFELWIQFVFAVMFKKKGYIRCLFLYFYF